MHSEPMIVVRDVPASVAWYKKLLGCRNDHGRPDFDRLIDGDRVLLMLHQTHAEEHGLPRPAPGHAGEGFLLWIHVDDLPAVHRRAKRLGAPIVVEPHDNPAAGWTEFTLRDPDGYRVAIVGR
jgi:catechol 2,3-dioxygenase-like lactoylglutathione lyase family enzyme